MTAMHKDWMFTSYVDILNLPESEIEYSIYQKEKCPTTGRLHWQGFIRFNTRKRFNSVKNLLGQDVHIEYARSVKHCIEYCSKSDTRVEDPIEIGVRPVIKRKLNMLEELKDKSCLQVIKENPTMWRSLKNMQALQSAMISPRKEMSVGVFFQGQTGKGKTKICHLIAEFVGVSDVYWATPDAQWFDGYSSQKMVIVDEVREMKPTMMLRMVDRYPLMLPVKGGFCQFKPSWIFFTSNLEMRRVVDCDYITETAIRRRINEYIIY